MHEEMADFAVRLAAFARQETLGRWASGCGVENKTSNGTFDPVTEADFAAERAMRAAIEERYPGHGIAGEEFGLRASSGCYRWSLDPIDGTRSFACGLPTWVTLIALLEDERPVVGVIDAPCLDELYVASGLEAWLHARGAVTRLKSSECTSLSDARLSTTDPGLFAGGAAGAFAEARAAAKIVRYGHDGYAYARLAGGGIDLIIEAGLKEHDYLALIPVVRGSGGVFGDWSGGAEFSTGNVIAAATPQLYDAAVAIMRRAA